MVTATGRPYGGIPAAERRAQRRRRLFDAGLELFCDRGIAGVTIGEICDRAGLIKRYFYEQFDSLDTFVDELMDDLMITRFAGAIPGPAGAARLRGRIENFAQALVAEPKLARFVLVETYGASGSLTRLRENLIHRTVEVMLEELSPPGRVDARTRRAVEMSAFALAGACGELALAWVEGQVKASAAEFVDYLVGLFASVAASVHGRAEGAGTPRRPAR